jgi:hypothetical protein
VYNRATADRIGEPLFKIVNPPTSATPEIIADTTIEKFQYRDRYVYITASETEIEERTKPLWEKGDNTWT